MIFENEQELRGRIRELAGRKVHGRLPISDDTSDYMKIWGGMVLRLEDTDYFVLGDATEGRFGIGDQPKFWVKNAVDLTDGGRKIIKLTFHEQFTTRLGIFTVRCHRSPEKESAVLDLVRGDGRFMQGRTVHDVRGNEARVIDFIRGQSFFNHVASLQQSHEEYYHRTLPGILGKLVGAIGAMDFLHRRGLEHGDIRNDHILVEAGTGEYRWIDFDYHVNYSDYDVFSMGNVLTYAIGKGIVTCKSLVEGGQLHPVRCEKMTPDDSLLFYNYRLANLRKAFPYVDPVLNELLMRFSAGAREMFTDFEQMARHLRAAMGSAWGGAARRGPGDRASRGD